MTKLRTQPRLATVLQNDFVRTVDECVWLSWSNRSFTRCCPRVTSVHVDNSRVSTVAEAPHESDPATVAARRIHSRRTASPRRWCVYVDARCPTFSRVNVFASEVDATTAKGLSPGETTRKTLPIRPHSRMLNLCNSDLHLLWKRSL
jgi:hypothetical protein